MYVMRFVSAGLFGDVAPYSYFFASSSSVPRSDKASADHTLKVNSFVSDFSPDFTVAVRVTAAMPLAGRVTWPSAEITDALLLDHVISVSFEPFAGRSIFRASVIFSYCVSLSASLASATLSASDLTMAAVASETADESASPEALTLIVLPTYSVVSGMVNDASVTSLMSVY